MAHVFSVDIRIVPDDPNNEEIFPPVNDGTNYAIEDTARAAAARPAAIAAAEATADMMPEGWHIEIPPEPPPTESEPK
jgi:hypothetical protein